MLAFAQFLYLSFLIRLFVVYSIRARTERYYNKWEYIYITIWNDLECITCYNKKNHVLLIYVSRFSMIGLLIRRWLSLINLTAAARVIFYYHAKSNTWYTAGRNKCLVQSVSLSMPKSPTLNFFLPFSLVICYSSHEIPNAHCNYSWLKTFKRGPKLYEATDYEYKEFRILECEN